MKVSLEGWGRQGILGRGTITHKNQERQKARTHGGIVHAEQCHRDERSYVKQQRTALKGGWGAGCGGR